jgi:4-amino-4-deoxy-L-arabinose transferase-like glycosyltransferase
MSWRQTQTAFTAVLYSKEGIDLLSPQVPVLGPPWVMRLEFPIFQAGAAILIDLGMQPEVALRGLSLLCFLATAGVLWVMLRRHISERVALIALVIFLFSPFALLWSRTSMIEYPAALGALLFMFGTLEWHAGRGRRWFVVAAVAGSMAALIKITTAVFWVAPALLTRRWGALLLCAIPGAIGLAWTLYAGAGDEAGRLTTGMTTMSWLEWNFGGNRLDPSVWLRVFAPALVWISFLLFPFALLVIHRSERLVWAWLGIALIAPMLVFTNLYLQHDYYSVAIAAAVAALAAGGLDRALEQAGRHRRSLVAIVATVAITATVISKDYWTVAYHPYDPTDILGGAAVVRQATAEDELVDLQCTRWSPAVMYYAERKGYASGGDGRYTRFTEPLVCWPGERRPDAQWPPQPLRQR